MPDGALLLLGGVAAGVFGSLLGLGGGILIVPFLTLVFGFPLLEAVGVSLVCVIMTSGAAAGVYLERRVANLRLGMTLELFTAIGALFGGVIAFLLPERLLEFVFALLLAYTALTMARRRDASEAPADDTTAREPDPSGDDRAFLDTLSGPGYRVHRLGFGVIGSVVAGIASALLGIGGGLVKVPVMHVIMGVPLRVATATSNLMIGITASASAIVYLARGGIDAYVAGPTAIGVFVGASLGSRLGHRVGQRALRVLFVVVLAYTAFEMVRRAAGLG
jgi:uncharacterized membrane protein YfcA